MKKDDNTTNYSARLVCEKCGYVFGLKEVAWLEHGGMIDPYFSKDKEILPYNEIYPKYCPKCKREAQHISYGVKLDVYCAKDKEEADIAIKKRKEEELINDTQRFFDDYCSVDVNLTKAPVCWDCEVVKQYCGVDNCKQKDSVSPKYFEKHGIYICAVFYTLSNANEFAKYLFHRTNNGRSDNISLMTISSAISRNNGYARMHKVGSFESIGAIPQTNEGRCGWSRKELKEYGIAIDFEKHPNTNEDIFCVYLPVPKYFGDKKEASK